jgi:hypothetical protein
LSRWRASTLALLALLPLLLAVLAEASPVVALRGIACFDQGRAVLHNGTILELPGLRHLAQLEPLDGCDIRGENLAAWRAGEVRVYRGLEPVFAVRGDRAFVGSRFLLVVGGDSVAVYSLHGFEVLRLDRYTVPAAVWVLEAQRSGGRAVVLVSPTTCRVRMQVESYLLVYDLDTGLYDVYRTGAAAFLAVPSGALWVKDGALYHNGRAIGKAPDGLYPVSNLDGYAHIQGDKVIIVAMNGSTYALPLPSGRGLAVSRLSEGFAACSDYECTCTFNCTGFTELARQAFAPLITTESGTHYLLYGNGWLFLVEKPRPSAVQPASAGSTTPGNATAPAATPQPGVLQPLNATEAQPLPAPSAEQPPANASLQAPSAPAWVNASATLGQSPTAAAPEQRARAELVPAWLLAAAAVAAVLVIYLLYRRRHL